MYLSFFGLKEKPFNLTPDPRYLYLSPCHQEALDHLLYGINERKGFIAVTGGIGTGKTTICRVLLGHLKENIRSALIFNSFVSDIELLKSINQELGIQSVESVATKKTYIDSLNRFLLEVFKEGGNTIVLIDEAQNLSQDVLEQIRMISNLETEKEKLVQIILVGQPELKYLLASPSLRQLNERITVRYELKPLDFKDIRRYVEQRLAVAGGHGNLNFTKGAIKKIYSYSLGNPRRINSVCDRALLLAYVAEKHTITPGIIQGAIKDLHGGTLTKYRYMDWSWKGFIPAALLIFLLIVVSGFGGWSFGRDIMDRFIIGQNPEPVRIKIREHKPEISRTILLNDQQSLSGLFTLYKKKMWKEEDLNLDLSLVQYDLPPENCIALKRPFRMLMKDTNPEAVSPQYLLICRINGNDIVVLDSSGKETIISREYFLKESGYKITCLYPFKGEKLILTNGMNSKEVLELQSRLNRIGYLINPTGVYDEVTSRNIKKFQKDFGLRGDGIAGPRTLALLDQMKEFDELY